MSRLWPPPSRHCDRSSCRHDARVLLPFAAVTLIWGSTFFVIRDQLGVVPPNWSICYRFVVAAVTMAIYARIARIPLTIGGRSLLVAVVLGLTIFLLNFNFVYRAEAHVASGVVALVFALLLPTLFEDYRWSAEAVAGCVLALAGLLIALRVRKPAL